VESTGNVRATQSLDSFTGRGALPMPLLTRPNEYYVIFIHDLTDPSMNSLISSKGSSNIQQEDKQKSDKKSLFRVLLFCRLKRDRSLESLWVMSRFSLKCSRALFNSGYLPALVTRIPYRTSGKRSSRTGTSKKPRQAHRAIFTSCRLPQYRTPTAPR